MSILKPIPVASKKDAHAPIEAQLAAFNDNKKDLLKVLRDGYKSGPKSKPFDADKSWEDTTRLARQYFWGQIMEQNALPTRERIKRLRDLSKALRQALGVTRRAISDSIGDDLYRAWFVKKNIPLTSAQQIDKDGSSALTRLADEINEMVEALARLEAISRAAAATADVPSNIGRPVLLPRDCIQGLARVYRTSTGAKPGRGDGPFADFAYGFMTAVGRTGFDYGSLIDAIRDAHRKFKPSWFDDKI